VKNNFWISVYSKEYILFLYMYRSDNSIYYIPKHVTNAWCVK
jgi:hypothetical protein